MKQSKQTITWPGFYSVLVASALFAGCASSGGGGTEMKGFLSIGMPAPAKAKVIFVRSPGARYAKFAVHDENRLIGTVLYHAYCSYECEPGHHLFSASLGNVAMLEADLLPNRLYYVEVHETHGMVAPGVEMHSIYPNCDGNRWKHLPKWLDGARETVLDAAAIEHDRQGIDRYMERVQKYRKEKYLTNPKREQILPEHGQPKPLGAP